MEVSIVITLEGGRCLLNGKNVKRALREAENALYLNLSVATKAYTYVKSH